jgi:GntR family transcriptional regulator, transcriptional repressor for pyruvate dehydrogenase complex
MDKISNDIYKSFENQIINGELRPGDKLPSENELCKIWDISRISVRQALDRLVSLGLLHKVSGSGTYVSEPDTSIFLGPILPFVLFRDENMIDFLEFRKIIEVGSVRLCAEHRDDENLANMKRCLDEMDKYFKVDKNQPYAEADLEFHMEIARGSKNPLNAKVNEMLRHTLRKNQITINTFLGSSGSPKEHHDIFIAIEERNAELAAHFMQKHIQRTIKEMQQYEMIKTYNSLKNP